MMQRKSYTASRPQSTKRTSWKLVGNSGWIMQHY